ncbi:MAG: DinB family protein [bacterium]|nr:DinB family protein [bacterium]
MNSTSVLVQAFHDAWSHKWEAFTPVIAGLTQVEADWQHPSYADLEKDEGWPPNGSILWHIAHMIECSERYIRVITKWDHATESQPANFDSLNLVYLLARLQTAHTDLARCVSDIREDRYLTTKSGMTLQEFVLMCARHDTWHAAQIAMGRRLYAYYKS